MGPGPAVRASTRPQDRPPRPWIETIPAIHGHTGHGVPSSASAAVRSPLDPTGLRA
jgi:hypothetical protein